MVKLAVVGEVPVVDEVTRAARRSRVGIGLLAMGRLLGLTPGQTKWAESLRLDPEDGPETYVAKLERVYVALDGVFAAIEDLRRTGRG